MRITRMDIVAVSMVVDLPQAIAAVKRILIVSLARHQSDYTPKRVAPITPPAGFVKTGVRRKTTSNVTPGAVGAYAIGTKVQHARFGAGTVIGTDGAGDNAKVKVDFGAAGVKNLLVKFANLTVLS